MTETIPANNIGEKEVGYVLLALMSKHAQDEIDTLLGRLSDELPDSLWTMPSDALHITLCDIIQPKDYGVDKTSMYQENAQRYMEVSRRVLTGIGKISVNFDTIEASQNAIIVRGEDNGSFNDIRAKLVEELSLPAGTKTPPNIIHSSIARYTEAVGLGEVQQVVSRHAISFEEVVSRFVLVRCTKQPLLEYEIIQTYELS